MEQNTTDVVQPDFGTADIKLRLRQIWRRRRVVGAVWVTLVALVAVYTLRQPKVFSATTSVIIDVTAPRFLDSNQVQDVTDQGTQSYWFNREYYETQNKVILSRAVASRVVEKLGLQNDPSFLRVDSIADPRKRADAMKAMDAIAILQGKITVEPVKDSRLIHIVIEDYDANRAALLANEVADAYMAENLALKLRITDSASQWLEERLSELTSKSKSSEIAVYDFKKQADMLTTSLEDRASMISQRLTTYNQQLTDVRARIALLKARVEAIDQLKKSSAPNDPRWAEGLAGADSTLLQSLKLHVVQTREECAEMSTRYLSDHPRMAACLEKEKTAEQDLERELNNIIRAANTELVQAVAQERNLATLLEQTKQEAFQVNKRQIEFDRLKRESDNDQRLYELVLKRLKDIELSGMLRTSNVRVLDAARPSSAPVRPDVTKILAIAILFGLIAGISLALAMDVLENNVSRQVDIEQGLGLPFLGWLPALAEQDFANPAQPDLQIHLKPKSALAECCRAVRTNLLFMSPDKPFKTLVVTSSSPQEGKSFTAINIGIAMAQSGNRVLLVDTDMRRPRLHKAFGVPNDLGVSSLVVGQGEVDSAIKSTDVPNLFVLPCGPVPPNPAELLHTKAFSDMLGSVAKRFDRVVLDSPPINAVADAIVLSTQVDGVLVVLKAGTTSKTLARRAVRSLNDVQAVTFGAVLNSVDLSDPKYGDEYYEYRHYGYTYGASSEKKDEATAA